MHGRVLAVLAIVVVVIGLATGHVLILRLSYVLTAVLLVSAGVAWTSVRWVEIERTTRSGRSEVGGLLEETFRVTNRGWVPKLWLEVRDHSEMTGHHASRVVSALGPSRKRSWNVRTRCRQRGVFTLGPLTLSGGDPLGMFRTDRELPGTATFIVYPRTVGLRTIEIPTGYLSGGPIVRRRAQYATANVRGVRDYRPGDELGRIHWPTTARRGRLFTKEFELDPVTDYWMLIDLDRTVHFGDEQDTEDDDHESLVDWLYAPEPSIEPTTEEYSITAAASLARHFIDQGKSVGLIAYGQRRTVLPPDRGDRQMAKILSNLAVLRAAGRTGLAQVLATETHEFQRNTTLVVVTPTTSVPWVDALRELRHRGVHSLAVLLEPSTFGTAPNGDAVAGALAVANVTVRRIRLGDDIAVALGG